ncbi:MAG: hypothetical protein ACFKPT_18300 [Gloeotrichia echinulata GP01]
MKSSVYRNAAVLACSLGLLGLLVGCLEMNVSFDATNPDTSSVETTGTPQFTEDQSSSVGHQTVTSVNVSSATSVPSNSGEDRNRKNTPLFAYSEISTGNAKSQGTLRMSNQTLQPVRLALLSRKSGVKGSTALKTDDEIPAHWDFAPGEGSQEGLLLSLPEGNLNLEKGDILVAFAQDGSRRYWGPYVVGETSVPKWNSRNREWQLILGE